ncbi:MAG: ferredoxin reductase [Dokdonella sp.]
MPLLAQPSPTRLPRPIQPLVASQAFDFWASRINPLWSFDRPLARIEALQAASSDAVTVRLKPNRHWGGFLPGQHVNIGAEVDGRRVTRSYSLTDIPRADNRISITVKAIEGGKLSRHLCRDARLGDVLDLGQAFGGMTLPALVQGAWMFLAAGSGITPLMAMIRALSAQGMPVPLMLLYWVRTRAELCFAQELRALAARHPSFSVQFILTREGLLRADERAGRIDAALLSSLVDDLPARQIFACGSNGFVAEARNLLAGHVRSFQSEAFSPPARAVDDAASVQVTLARSGRTLQLSRGQSLLEGLEAAGLTPASGCRMGICNTCACTKVSGSTRNLHTGEDVHEPVSALRLCVNSATADLVLDL